MPRKQRYFSGTLIEIPKTFPGQLNKYKMRTKQSAEQISLKVGRDSRGVLVSAHAISNLLCHEHKPVQKRVGMVLLSRLQELVRAEAATHRAVVVVQEENATPTVPGRDRRHISNLVDIMGRLLDVDYNLVFDVAERLDTNKADRTRKQEAIEKLLETAERIEAGL
jgi:hypothetical protein